MQAGMGLLFHHNLKAPDEVAVFRVPREGIRRWDDAAIVYDVRLGADRALRHYAFPGRWFQVNCSLDGDGRLITEPGLIDFSFNCDICTPIFAVDGAVYVADLELDVLIAPDGREHVVKDWDQFEHSIGAGWITGAEADGAREGLEELLELIRSGRFLTFLVETCPFVEVGHLPLQPPVTFQGLAETPLLRPDVRHRYHREV